MRINKLNVRINNIIFDIILKLQMVKLAEKGHTGTGVATFVTSVAVGVGTFILTGGNAPAASVAVAIVSGGSALGAPPKGK